MVCILLHTIPVMYSGSENNDKGTVNNNYILNAYYGARDCS